MRAEDNEALSGAFHNEIVDCMQLSFCEACKQKAAGVQYQKSLDHIEGLYRKLRNREELASQSHTCDRNLLLIWPHTSLLAPDTRPADRRSDQRVVPIVLD